MKICIFGAGAVGGTMAGWLHKAGYDVSVVARGANLTAIREHGLRIRTHATGEVASFRVRAEADPRRLGVQDCVIVTLKAQSLPEAARAMPALAGPGTSIVTAMNGVPWWFFDRLRFGDREVALRAGVPKRAVDECPNLFKGVGLIQAGCPAQVGGRQEQVDMKTLRQRKHPLRAFLELRRVVNFVLDCDEHGSLLPSFLHLLLSGTRIGVLVRAAASLTGCGCGKQLPDL